MKKLALLSCIVAGSLSLTGCQHYQETAKERETVGTLLGGIGGAILGSAIGTGDGRIVGTAAGAVLGALIGHEIAENSSEGESKPASWDSYDNTQKGWDYPHKKRAYDSFYHATGEEMGHTVYWDDRYSGSYGSVRPIRDGFSKDGLYCREFQTTVYVDGRAERLYGTACRHRDGRWMPI